MKFHALVLIGSATLLAGCTNQQMVDCDGATTTQYEYGKCLDASNKAQYDAHREVVKDFASRS